MRDALSFSSMASILHGFTAATLPLFAWAP
jgi:hypothetical protein